MWRQVEVGQQLLLQMISKQSKVSVLHPFDNFLFVSLNTDNIYSSNPLGVPLKPPSGGVQEEEKPLCCD